MAEAHDQFFPDDVDEQIEEYRWKQTQASPDYRLIRDLSRLYQEDSYIIQRVWERLSPCLPPVRAEFSAE